MKRKGHLAVFENILEGANSKNEDEDEDSNGLVVDEDVTIKKNMKEKPLSQERRLMICRYQNCSKEFDDYINFDKHLVEHINDDEDAADGGVCKFGDCDLVTNSYLHTIQHISLHGYYERLHNLGTIVARRNSLPDCNMENSITFPVDVETYTCKWDHCDMTMKTYCDFLCHVKMHVNGNPANGNIKCGWEGCMKQLTRLYQLTKHVRVHTRERYIACPTCSSAFGTLIRYADHRNRQIPAEKQNYKCSQCFKLFASEDLLRNHVRGHINQYKCSLCDMTCPKPSNLAIHMRYRHLNVRPYKCNLCNHASISKQNLEQHLITHCAEKLLACDECDYQCRTMYGLDRHIQREHCQTYGAVFECHICKKQYVRGSNVTRHLMKIHGVQWPSGHSRFRYKEDPDGICRLQTMRYETVDVTKEIIRSKTCLPSSSIKKMKCSVVETKDKYGKVLLNANFQEISPDVEEDTDSLNVETSMNNDPNNVVLTISDLDEMGNIVSEVTESQMVLAKDEIDIEEEKFIKVTF